MAKYLKIVVTSVLLFVCLSLSMQAQPYLTVRWTGEWDGKEVPIDSVQVTNLTKDWTTTVFYPEKSIKLYHSVGIMERDFANGQIQVKPNPFSQTATVEFYVGKEGNVLIRLYDVFGRTVASLSQQMDCGTQQVAVNVGSSGYYFISVETTTEKRVAKLLSTFTRHSALDAESITYKGIANNTSPNPSKTSAPLSFQGGEQALFSPPEGGKSSPFGGIKGGLMVGKASQKSDELPFDLGDSLQFIAFATDTNGKVHEYLPQSSKILEDKELRFIYIATKVLVLKVDYLTNTFLGGKELEFSKNSSTFTITHESRPPGDFGYTKLFYKEIGELLFHGTTIWAGVGKIVFPQDLFSPEKFDTDSNGYVLPQNGFEDALYEDLLLLDSNFIDDRNYEPIWASVQSLTKVREYLQSNPNQKVRFFLFVPCTGDGSGGCFDKWCWFIYLKQ